MPTVFLLVHILLLLFISLDIVVVVHFYFTFIHKHNAYSVWKSLHKISQTKQQTVVIFHSSCLSVFASSSFEKEICSFLFYVHSLNVSNNWVNMSVRVWACVLFPICNILYKAIVSILVCFWCNNCTNWRKKNQSNSVIKSLQKISI